jgi:hypothetical protein
MHRQEHRPQGKEENEWGPGEVAAFGPGHCRRSMTEVVGRPSRAPTLTRFAPLACA